MIEDIDYAVTFVGITTPRTNSSDMIPFVKFGPANWENNCDIHTVSDSESSVHSYTLLLWLVMHLEVYIYCIMDVTSTFFYT